MVQPLTISSTPLKNNKTLLIPSTPGMDLLDSDNNIWSSILDSVANTRGVVTKNLIILGTNKTGKSTLISRLATPTGEALNGEDDLTTEVLDLGLSYTCLDVGDEGEEDALARLGIYQLPSTLPPYPSLLPLALSKSTLLDSMVMIVLDWERPWQFLKDLRAWLGVLEGVLKVAGEGWEGAEGRERVEAHLRHYFEPSISPSTTRPNASQLVDTETPLPPGILTNNLGISLVIVCTKSDQINSLERDKDFKEEQFDYVQQTLRTIALRYGAAVFFTSHSRPTSFAKLRSYILHRLFSPPIISSIPTATSPLPTSLPSTNSTTTATTTTTATSKSFQFPYRANVVDRDQVLVPSGWDSWGKIKILRDRFDADGVGKGWELDMELLREGKGSDGGEEERVDEEGKRVTSAVRMYDEVVMDLDGDDLPTNFSHSRVEAQDEQEFLKVHYETLQKDREKDPRAAFASRSPYETTSTTVDGLRSPAAVVGPMSTAGASMMTLERANEELASSRMSRKDSSQSNSARSPLISNSLQLNNGNPLSPSLNSVAMSSPSLSSSGLPPTPGGGQAQNEVLAKFFASLLAKRGTGSSPNGGEGSEELPPTV